jgi:transcriptional regulator with GAF, ATPase, and Fis domain
MASPQQKAASAYLVIRQGGRWSDVFRLQPDQPLLIGRSSQCAIVVPDDRTSRQHAEVFFNNGQWLVRDLGSRNGTTVDGNLIEGAHPLANGQVIQVASCRVTFADSLGTALPDQPDASHPAESGNSGQATQEIDDVPTITHQTQVESWSSELTFNIAQQPSWEEACESALSEVLRIVKIQAGGILGLSQPSKEKEPLGLTILSARERPGKAYHRVSDFLWKSVVADQKALLARNIQNDVSIGDIQSSQVQRTTSVICAPIHSGDSLIGLFHIYTRDDEAMLNPQSLEVVLTATQMLGAGYQLFGRQRRLQKKLSASVQQVQRLKEQLTDHQRQFEMIGNSPAMKKLESQLERVAKVQATVLLRGESGVGKELAARQIHRLSPRSDKAFIAINCGALTPSLLESELFGHEKGSFTGATERKLGKFELADGGTLMLDEVGEMSPEIQVKFLRVLEGQPFERVGGSKPISVNVRVIAATNRDLEAAVKEGKFRSDLYFRLRVVEIGLPSLRDRPEDVLPLARHFLETFRKQSGHGPIAFSPRAEQAIQSYNWPGNIRELRNSVERAHVLSINELAEPEDLALSDLGSSQPRPSLNPTSSNSDASFTDERYTPSYRERSLDEVERDHILATLQFTNGQKSRAATILGIERSTLDRKLKRFEEDGS